MRKLLLSALFIPALLLSCSTDSENRVTKTDADSRNLTPKSLCVPVSGEDGINAQALGVSRRLFITWNNNVDQNPSRLYESRIEVTNINCLGGTPQIIDTYPIDLFNTNSLALHQLSGTCFDWRIVVKGYKLSSEGQTLTCTTQTPWTNYTP